MQDPLGLWEKVTAPPKGADLHAIVIGLMQLCCDASASHALAYSDTSSYCIWRRKTGGGGGREGGQGGAMAAWIVI